MSVSYNPKFERSAKLVRQLSDASGICSWINQQTVSVSWIAPTQRESLIRLAHYSTRIEGNPLTLPEVEALADGKDLPVENRAKQEVLNYFSALRWIWKNSHFHIKEKALLKLHKIIIQGLLPNSESGSYKTKPNAVFSHGRIIYKPPPPEAAPILTQGLLSWLNSKQSIDEHPVIIAAIAHHRLASIHPFMDGNGRVARAVESWILYRRGFDTHHIFALDEFFDLDRNRYYREIQKVRYERDDLTSWLEYIGEGILETLRKTQMRIQALRVKKPASKILLTQKQERILQILSQSPHIRGGNLARSLGITRSNLSKLLKPLLKYGMVVKKGSTKAAIYQLK